MPPWNNPARTAVEQHGGRPQYLHPNHRTERLRPNIAPALKEKKDSRVPTLVSRQMLCEEEEERKKEGKKEEE